MAMLEWKRTLKKLKALAWFKPNKNAKLNEMVDALEELNELDVDDEIAKHNTLVEIKDLEANLNVQKLNISTQKTV